MTAVSAVRNAQARARARRRVQAAAAVIPLHRIEEPPFDAPDADDLAAMVEAAPEPAAAAHVLDLCVEARDEAPFDPPAAEDDIFRPYARAVSEQAPPEPPPRATPAPIETPLAAVASRPLPAIRVLVSWDRPETGAAFAARAADARFARADVRCTRGGLDGAVASCASGVRPDLIVLDTTLSPAHLRAGLARLADAIAAGTKLIVLGAINDVTLMRDLAARGVSEYLVAPVGAEQLAAAMCALFADRDCARLIAVVGARGGVGASTLARNLAWSIAERHDAPTALVDLDLSFGDAGLAFNLHPPRSRPCPLEAPERAGEALVRVTSRLELLHAPSAPARAEAMTPAKLNSIIAALRRTSAFLVLDLPHVWTPWLRHALSIADDVVLAAGPDLASLRNADHLLKRLTADREGLSAPCVVLSMTGVPKRPEISQKDFAQSLKTQPVATLPFAPDIVGEAAVKAAALGAHAPASAMARDIDALATRLTRRAPAPPGVAKRAPGPAHATTPLALRPADATPPEEAYLAQARLAAAVPAPPPRRRRSTGLVRRVAALIALLIASIWWLQSERNAAQAAEPPEAAQTRDQRFESALAALEDGRSADAVATLRELAEEDYAAAFLRLAKLYETGEGVAADSVRARRWTQRAAEAGDVRAMHDLGVYFALGEGGPRDDTAAFRWFLRAAERGLADSQYNVGVFHQTGRGVTADAAEALYWFTLAARQGDAGAAAQAESISRVLTPMHVEQARFRADAFVAR